MRHAIIGLVGQTEYGKTYRTKIIVKSARRVVVIDPKGEFNEDFFIKTTIPDVVESMLKTEFRISAQFREISDYELLFIALKEFSDYTLVCEELSLFCSAQSTNEDLRQIVQIVGSKQAINFIWNAQRPANVSRDISSQSHVVISFRVLEAADSKYFSSKWRSREGEQELSLLGVGDFRIVRGDLETFQKIQEDLDSYDKNL